MARNNLEDLKHAIDLGDSNNNSTKGEKNKSIPESNVLIISPPILKTVGMKYMDKFVVNLHKVVVSHP